MAANASGMSALHNPMLPDNLFINEDEGVLGRDRDDWYYRRDNTWSQQTVSWGLDDGQTSYGSTFSSLKHWLLDCDENHRQPGGNCHMDSRKRILPTRLLNVNPSPGQLDRLRLDIDVQPTSEQYIALSYCWGDNPVLENEKEWRTTKDNLKDRCDTFSLHDLPKTLKDAIEVTRQLGFQYLWIDSLCIIQADDNDDWKRESERMEAVFSSAYCTIAATAAKDVRSSFLEGYATETPRSSTDFDNDTINAPLNKRAWVMQERYLSPRTIHFCGGRVYGECGDGVYMRNSTVLLQAPYSSEKYFQLDPRFPERLQTSGVRPTFEFLQSLIENYSNREITRETDRSIAIQGLMNRISEALPCKIHHGIIKWYLHRTLLWRRDGKLSTPKIPDCSIPSWSWMAYPGGISFIHKEYRWGGLDVINDIRFDKDALEATVWRFLDSDITIRGDRTIDKQFLDLNGSTRGWISLDTEDKLWRVPDLVVLARSKQNRHDGNRYFVLFVELQESGDYERRGVGMIQEGCELLSMEKHYIN